MDVRKIFYNHGGKTPAQIAQRGEGCPMKLFKARLGGAVAFGKCPRLLQGLGPGGLGRSPPTQPVL